MTVRILAVVVVILAAFSAQEYRTIQGLRRDVENAQVRAAINLVFQTTELQSSAFAKLLATVGGHGRQVVVTIVPAAISRMSAAMANTQPPAIACPLTAATTGAG